MILFLICVMTIIILIPFTKLSLDIKIVVKNRENHSYLTLALFGGLVELRLNFTMALLKKGVISFLFGKKHLDIERQYDLEDVHQYLTEQIRLYKKYGTEIRHFISKVSLDRLCLNLRIGLGDSASTAIVCGMIQSLMAGFHSFAINHWHFEDIEGTILPNFKEEEIQMDFNCIIHVKLGHIITTAIGIFIQGVKGGDIFGRTPHRKYNDYHYGKY